MAAQLILVPRKATEGLQKVQLGGSHSKSWAPVGLKGVKNCTSHVLKKRKRKDSAGSDDTASMIKGGGYLGACTRQPPTTQTIKKESVWVRGVVCHSTQTQALTVVAFVILQCIPCF
jgi:hypothetical protein